MKNWKKNVANITAKSVDFLSRIRYDNHGWHGMTEPSNGKLNIVPIIKTLVFSAVTLFTRVFAWESDDYMAEGRYYWIKLKRDFFKRHDIRIIEEMQNGKDYILFYLKLLCESVDHDGNLRFSEQIPYSEQMLSVITNTNLDIVRSAINT